jgi:hypothetical protein
MPLNFDLMMPSYECTLSTARRSLNFQSPHRVKQRKQIFKEAQAAPSPPRLDSLGVGAAVALVLSAKSGSNESETFGPIQRWCGVFEVL